MTESKARVDYDPQGLALWPFAAECPICGIEVEGHIKDDDEVMVVRSCGHFLKGEMVEDGDQTEDILTIFWDDDFDHWFAEVEKLVSDNNLTDLTDYELPKETLRSWFDQNITPFGAAYKIATEGI